MKHQVLVATIAAALLTTPTGLSAQSATSGNASAQSTAAASDGLSQQELHDLVAPVALYPDTLLIQILVAATYPLDVVKADRLVQDHNGKPADELQAAVEQQGWDESVAVLAMAFPDVLTDMTVHIEWTEAIGTAMLAQSDDVMAAVQDMRQIANDLGALQTGAEQTVEVTQDAGDETIIIQPTDPQVVYVPQYDPEVVYVQDNSNNTGNLIGAGLITWGTIALIDEIFDNDDHWHGYWGCHNCGGWNGRPIINNPNIDIDIDGDVNIGQGNGNNIGWKPDDNKRDKARDDIARKRDPDGHTKLPTKKPDRGDEMRQRLSKETGAADISRPGADRSAVKRPENRDLASHKPAIDRTRAPAAKKPSAKPAAAPKVKKPKAAQTATRKPSGSGSGGAALKKTASAPRTKAGGTQGRAAAGGGRRR